MTVMITLHTDLSAAMSIEFREYAPNVHAGILRETDPRPCIPMFLLNGLYTGGTTIVFEGKKEKEEGKKELVRRKKSSKR